MPLKLKSQMGFICDWCGKAIDLNQDPPIGIQVHWGEFCSPECSTDFRHKQLERADAAESPTGK